MRRALIALGVLAVAIAVAAAAAPRPPTPEERVARIASELRCPVCQGLSVNDSPTGTAREMRALIEQRVREGRSDAEIRDEFRRSYGDWILLAPPTDDWRGVAWILPAVIVGAGALVVLSRMRARPAEVEPTPDQVAVLRERARLEETEP